MKIIFTVALHFTFFYCYSQSPASAYRDELSRHLTYRLYQFAGDSQQTVFPVWQPLRKQEIANMASEDLRDAPHYQYLLLNNWQYTDKADYQSSEPFLKKLYRAKADMFHYRDESFTIQINPLLYAQAGRDSETDELLYRNTRGLSINGLIDNKVYFQTQVTENQFRLPAYVRQRQQQTGVIPGYGFWKLLGENAYDLLFASGHVGFNATRHIQLELGHDRFFVGNGYRSVVLSDFGNNFPYFKIRTKIWKFQYTNLYAQLTADVGFFDGGTLGSREFPKKFMTMHHLSMNVSKKLNIGLFESIIFSRQDSTGNNSFDFTYLNPVIFYRSIEQHTGSPDNALLGVDFNWKAFGNVSFYGQFVIDEFIASNVFGDRGNWTNKYAYQIGAKYFDILGVSHLDLQGEFNFGRPYVFSHDEAATSYSHYRQPLAHPLGANFREIAGIIRYQPVPKLFFTGKLILSEYGQDPADRNFGGNILLPNTTRESDTDNFVGQGINTQLLFAQFRASYMLKQNLFVDLTQVWREENTDLPAPDRSSSVTSIGIRLNMAHRDQAF